MCPPLPARSVSLLKDWEQLSWVSFRAAHHSPEPAQLLEGVLFFLLYGSDQMQQERDGLRASRNWPLLTRAAAAACPVPAPCHCWDPAAAMGGSSCGPLCSSSLHGWTGPQLHQGCVSRHADGCLGLAGDGLGRFACEDSPQGECPASATRLTQRAHLIICYGYLYKYQLFD